MKGEERKRKGSEDNPQEEAWNEAKGSDWSVGCETIPRQKSWCSVTASSPSSLFACYVLLIFKRFCML